MNWVHQINGWGLGNFINLTPTIKAFANKWGYKVPVYFDQDYVRLAFLDCPFIKILSEKPSNLPFMRSNIVNQKIPDWEYIYKLFKNRYALPDEIPEAYVDMPKTPIKGKYSVLFNGCYADARRHTKDPGRELVTALSRLENHTVFVGSVKDMGASPYIKLPRIIDDVRLILALINGASAVYGNACGWYHVACAMNKKGLILWKDCNYIKNQGRSNSLERISVYDKDVLTRVENYKLT